MATDDFLMVTTPGWVEVQEATAMIEAWGENGIVDAFQQRNLGEFDAMLEAAGLIQPGYTVGDVRMFNTGEAGPGRLRLWVVFIEVPVDPQAQSPAPSA